MAEQINTDEIAALNTEILVRGIIEQTKSPGLIWAQLDATSYRATVDDSGTIWDFLITKSKATGEGYNFNLDILKNATLNNSIKEESSSTSEGDPRSTGVEELYTTVESVILDTDENKLKDANALIFNLPNCR